MFYTWCKKVGYSNQFAKGYDTYKKDLFDRHIKNKEHNLLEKARKGNQLNIIQSISQQVNNDKEKIINQMKCVYFAAKNHLSLNLYPNLYNLVLNSNKNTLQVQPHLFQLLPLSFL